VAAITALERTDVMIDILLDTFYPRKRPIAWKASSAAVILGG
jgi:hypothetical protein